MKQVDFARIQAALVGKPLVGFDNGIAKSGTTKCGLIKTNGSKRGIVKVSESKRGIIKVPAGKLA